MENMKKYLRICVIVMSFALIAISIAGCAKVPGGVPIDVSLGSEALDTVRNAVLEVVVPKPETDSLQYEKQLPIDLLPYSIRTDKYYSIGTAFAISPSQFVSAAHVMFLGSGSQFGDVYLRDKEGKIYRIDKIIKYSLSRDFVVFSLKKGMAKRFLPINAAPQVNQKVFAVGNALAQGIIIRDGLYTSTTLEEEAGEWQWMRFSAAASPGNSGGPLLDKDGNVIGIVLRKSENENLNYALPIAEVMKAPANVAVIHMKMKYVLDNMDMTKVDTFHKEISLPKTYAQLDGRRRRLSPSSQTRCSSSPENRKNVFPTVRDPQPCLTLTTMPYFPCHH
jgi:hypothetical protein